ncbi:MAG: helix-turn-helix transcriptional regulator [Lachnospiraceae bacterium]
MSKLKSKRIESKLSQSQLAEKANINVRTLQHYEQGSKSFDNARIDTILRVCLALDCKIEDVVENEEYIKLLKRYLISQRLT